MSNKKIASSQYKHPRALPWLFLTEMWERYGFYVVEGMLILYLTQFLNFNDDISYSIVGAFTAFVYITPVIGGFLADRCMGYRFSILLGALLLALGYGWLSIAHHNYIYWALGLIIVGNGFFKPNISSLLGILYNTNDPRRDSGFTIFYIGINVGAMLGTISAGYIKDWLGWQSGFASAGIGLIIGFFTFLFSLKTLNGEGRAPQLFKSSSNLVNILKNKWTQTFLAVLSISIFALLVNNKDLANILLVITGVFLLILIFAIAFKQKTTEYRNKTIALIILTLLSVVFWAVFFQVFFSVNLFTERDINRVVFGHQIPTTAFISIESIFIILTGPFLARLWQNLSRKKKNPSTAMKFSFSYLFIAGGYFLLSLGTHFSNSQGLVSPLWIVACYFFVTLGEMLLSPIGLSAVTALSPPRLVGLMMGIWLIAIGFGGKLGGEIAKFSSIPENLNNHLLENSLYGQAFLKYALISLLVSVLIALFANKLKRLMAEDKQSHISKIENDEDPKTCDIVT